MKEKEFLGILSASPKKRYKNFVSTVADFEYVWLLESPGEGYGTVDIDDTMYLLVWPKKEFAEAFADGCSVTSIEVHDFCERCEQIEDHVKFMVFPNGKNTCIVDAETLLDDILEKLAELE